MRRQKTVEVYTDGACTGNPGPGGWGVILRFGEHERELSGFEAQTTNNRMELTAAIEGLRTLKEPCRVKLFSDSQYLVKAFQAGWLDRWQRNGWRTAAKAPVENQDLWQELLRAAARHEVEWAWVRGHADNEYNNHCDRLARAAIAANTQGVQG